MPDTPQDSDFESRRDFLFQSFRRLARLATGDLAESIDARPPKPAIAAPPPSPPPVWLNRRENMAYAPLGRTGFMTSRFVLGSRDLPVLGPEAWSSALDHGVNLMVTTPDSVRHCDWLPGQLQARRHDFWIAHVTSPEASFFGSLSIDPAARQWFDIDRFEEELTLAEDLLQTRIDLFLLGGIDRPVNFNDEDLVTAVRRAQHGNRFRSAGIALDASGDAVLEAALEADWIDVILLPFNALNFSEVGPLINEATERGIGVLGARTTRGLVERAGDAPPSLMELPEDLNAHELAYLYMIKNGPQAGFVSHFGTRANLERSLALPALTLDTRRANELDAVVEDELWPSDEVQASRSP